MTLKNVITLIFKSMSIITKRDGTSAPFDASKITNAIAKAFRATDELKTQKDADIFHISQKITDAVVADLKKLSPAEVTVETAQNIVEIQLMSFAYYTTARAYITYRNERTSKRTESLLRLKSNHLKRLTAESNQYFASKYEEIIYYRTYSRWLETEGRRETWVETVQRYIDLMTESLGDKIKADEVKELHDAILRMEIMPSMRLLQFAGPAAKRNNLCVYNCCFVAPTCLADLRDIMYVSMCGTGVGWSVERRFVEQFPVIQRKKETKEETKSKILVVEDSKEGWCDAFLAGIDAWYNGGDLDFDFSQVRPAGARLRTMGGRASGPAPLEQLLQFARTKIQARQGARLTPLDLHDIICMIGQIVVVGGVRRSAMISISDLDEDQIRTCKSGEFWVDNSQRSMANNSAAYDEVPSDITLMREWLSLATSGTGERGIFNRVGFNSHLPKRRVQLLGDRIKNLGTNPCGEVILQSHGLCNLSTVMCRPNDTVETLTRKIRLASILGTYQATLTKFQYVSNKFQKRAEEERLLGVSMTGQQDCPIVRNESVLRQLKDVAIKTNESYSTQFGINISSSITLVKPEGTVSEMVNAAPGVHPRFAKYYLRRVRISAHDPLFHMLKAQGVRYHPEVGQQESTATTFVLEFPIKSPEGSITNSDVTAIDMLNYWRLVKTAYCEHNPSVTINVDKDEWIAALNWIKANWDIVGGLAFLQKSDHIYKLAPYEAITEDQYTVLATHYAKLDVDFSKIVYYEKEDTTDVKREVACAGGACAAV